MGSPMTITAITCTHGRPEAFALCQRYLAQQTRQPDQWLVLDSDAPMPAKILNAIDAGIIKGDIIVFFEDDDLFRADWLAWCEEQITKGYDLVGEGLAVYYHVSSRWWSECRNVRHAALCQSAITRDMLEPLANVIRSFESPFFDTRLWQLDCSKLLVLPKNPAERRVIGIKGMPGKLGYSGEHSQLMPKGVNADPSMRKLWEWAPKDAANYLPFGRKGAA